MKRITLLISILIATTAQAAPAQAPATAGGGTGGDAVVLLNQQLQMFVATIPRPKQAQELQRLVKAISAIEDRNVKMSAKRRLRIATAALKASKATGVDAVLLISVARMESDFRGLQHVDWRCRDRRYYSCQADCGITQHYISGPRAWVIRRCRQIANDYSLSFLKSAKELARHVQYCQARQRYNKPLRRCVLNRYNSGTFYRTAARCHRRWVYCRKWTPKSSWAFATGIPREERQHRYNLLVKARARCNRSRARCLGRAVYWKTVLCFHYGAVRGIRSKRNCRLMGRCSTGACRHRWGLSDVPTMFYGQSLPTASR